MAQQHINLGTAPGGVDGDTNRTANTKTEANFTELYTSTAAATSALAGLSQYAGFKNLIINGNFHFWQRGTSLAAGSGGYLCDRWQSFANGSTTAPSQQAFVLGQTAVPNGPTYFHRVVVASVANAGNYAGLLQKMEGLERFSGAQCTASFWAKADANRSIGFEIQKVYGAGGSATDTTIGAVAIALTTLWQKFTITFTVPSNAGKTFAGGNDSLVFALWMDAGATFATRASNIGQQSGTFDIAQVQIEKGAVATPFESRPIGIELTLCQRYYEKSFPIASAPVQNFGANTGEYNMGALVAGTNTNRLYAWPFAVIKRAVPALTTYNPSAANTNPRDKTGGVDGTVSGTVITASSLQFSLAGNTSTVVGNGLGIHWSVDAEL